MPHHEIGHAGAWDHLHIRLVLTCPCPQRGEAGQLKARKNTGEMNASPGLALPICVPNGALWILQEIVAIVPR